MDTMQIIEIVVCVLCVIGYVVLAYFKVRGNVVEMVSELIAAAEATGLAGSDKMAMVVSKLFELVPAPFKAVLTEKMLQTIAQRIFNWMKQYALNYIEAKKEEDEEKQKQKLFEQNADTTAAVLVDLIKLSKEALIEKAENCNLQLTGNESKDELIKQIVLAVLKEA